MDGLRPAAESALREWPVSRRVSKAGEGEDDTTVLERLKLLLDTAERANECGSELSAADIWQEAFEHMFPMPEATEVIAEDTARNAICRQRSPCPKSV